MSDQHDDDGARGAPGIPQHAQVHHEESGEGWLISYADMMTLLVGFFVVLLSFANVDDEKFEQVRQAAVQQFGGVYEVPYGPLADRIKDSMAKFNLGGQLEVKQTPFGVEISFIGTAFFDSGTAEIKDVSRELIERLMPVIQAEAKGFDVLIEGHTDDAPVVGSPHYRNNWDLSSVRACRVLDLFEKAGFTKDKLTAVGYADSRPIAVNRDAAGSPILANQSQNRRVVIKVTKPNEGIVLPDDKSGATTPKDGADKKASAATAPADSLVGDAPVDASSR